MRERSEKKRGARETQGKVEKGKGRFSPFPFRLRQQEKHPKLCKSVFCRYSGGSRFIVIRFKAVWGGGEQQGTRRRERRGGGVGGGGGPKKKKTRESLRHPPPVSGVLTSGESKLDSSILWQWEKALVFLRALEARVPLVFERGREKPLSQALSSSLTPQCFLSVFSSLFFSPIFSLRARARETTLPPLSLLQPSEAKVSMYREWQKRIGRAEGCFIRCQFSGVFFFFF